MTIKLDELRIAAEEADAEHAEAERADARARTKRLLIRNVRTGRITGSVLAYWSDALRRYVTIPSD